MINCPDKSLLIGLLEEELDDKEQSELIKHLTRCGACREKLQDIANKEKNLLKTILASPIHKTVKKQESEKCYSRLDLLKYIYDILRVVKKTQIEEHLSKCAACTQILLDLQTGKEMHSNLDLDISVLSQNGLCEQSEDDSVLELTLKVNENFLELLRHSGGKLSFLSLAEPFENNVEMLNEKFILEKNFNILNMSLKIAINRNLNYPDPPITASAVESNTEMIVSDLALSSLGKKLYPKNYANPEGKVSLHDTRKGNYGIWKADQLIARIRIK
ncbi:MAG TPA: hypothetical protein PKW97_11005 [Syntrophorhabdus sp.]|jgi:cytidine deaminase|nr:hypothetical protein [Syntrophorhabdus sp.]OQB77218.1 MAG: hypothetical protein BWX92_01171 [Deltaproteobacteria bacterium ADurb.Bin135]HOD77035.1 hypothetical protein [Syntrophorhabdus sp.]HQM27030.1 hypothetical protein [Syntrophorhabdus sp.]